MCDNVYDLSHSLKKEKIRRLDKKKEEIINGERSRIEEDNSEEDNGDI